MKTLERLLPVLKAWRRKVENNDVEWMEKVVRCAPAGVGEEDYLPYFHRYALQGVVEVLQGIGMAKLAGRVGRVPFEWPIRVERARSSGIEMGVLVFIAVVLWYWRDN